MDAARLAHPYSAAELEEIRNLLVRLMSVRDVLLKVNQAYIQSAAQDDRYRQSPPFRLQGSYRNMARLAPQVTPLMTPQEIGDLLRDHYRAEAQTLTSGAEENLHMPLDNYALQLCDVGAGAGFPSIPLKIVHPELQVTIVDSLQKRLTFIDHLAQELGLEGVSCVHGRAEDVGQNPVYRGQFDLVTARAVASLNVLAEYCLPLVKIGGQFLALKAQKSDQELEEAGAAIRVLGAKLIKVTEDQLPVESADRRYILIQKTKETPNKYPRKAGKPAKNPIKA